MKPPPPSTIPRIPTIRSAEIETHDGWWFRYIVRRSLGIFIPENSISWHRTLKGAQRAAKRHTRPQQEPRTVERHADHLPVH